ncbi:MAG: hypothetical protein L3J35_03735 [Bacteroidales bacterium]|nr:hypothetical protein [Bacteroidales bacterium]
MRNYNCKLIDVNNDKLLKKWNTEIVPDIGDKVKINKDETLFVVQREFNVSNSADIKVFGMLNVPV